MKKIRRLIKKVLSIIFFQKQKTVIAIPEQVRFGNHLYFFLHCDIERKKGINIFIRYTENMSFWLKEFPALTTFVTYPENLHFFDNFDWFKSYYQDFGKDFTQEDLNNFIKSYLINEKFKTNKRIAFNIRRGDFYIGKNDMSAFDQLSYLKKILECHAELKTKTIEIVSDDVEWCKKNITIEDVSFIFNESKNPIDHFYTLSNSCFLAVTNSTFSYWSGYISKYLNKENVVLSPDFGGRHYKDNIAIQLHPEWEIIHLIIK